MELVDQGIEENMKSGGCKEERKLWKVNGVRTETKKEVRISGHKRRVPPWLRIYTRRKIFEPHEKVSRSVSRFARNQAQINAFPAISVS